MIAIRPADLDDPVLRALLTLHAERARAETAQGSAHALNLDALRTPDIRVWTAQEGEALLGAIALKRIDVRHGEVKSMYTSEAARRRGIGSALLRHLIAEARADGLARLSLETGSWGYFAPARALYRAHGFVDCAPFGDYRADPNSIFLTRSLADPPAA